MEQLTYLQAFICDIAWLIAFLMCYRSMKYHTSRGGYFYLWIFITLYSTFEFTGGDFYHYKGIYQEVQRTRDNIHLEEIYYWLIKEIPASFYLWRCVVWGLAAMFWIWTLKNLKLDVKFAGLLFLLIVFFLFVGARQALCFSVLYFALTIIYKEDVGAWNKCILVVPLIIMSYFLHKTAITYILILLLVMLPIGKKTIILSLILFPVIYGLFDLLLDYFLSHYYSYNEFNAGTMKRYLDTEALYQANIYGKIKIIIDRFPIFLLLIYSMINVYFKKEEISKVNHVLLLMTYSLIYISYLFVGRNMSSFIAPRFWDAALFPLTLFLSGYLVNRTKYKFIRICIWLLLFSKLYTIAYTIYKI